MNGNYKSKVIKSFKIGNLFGKFICSLLIPFGYSNNRIIDLQVRYKTLRYIEKKYCNKTKIIKFDYYNESRKKIWICWLQGFETAPKLVKECLKSVKYYMNDFEINLLTKDNFNNYVEIPEYIIQKWNNKIITNTAFSDILRTAVLVKHGGIWMDATVYLTGRIPEFVYNEPLFLFQQKNWGDLAITYNSWFISCKAGNNLLNTVLNYLYDYWNNENKIREYFVWHLIFTIALKHDTSAEKIYNIPDANCELLSQTILDKYNEKYFREITKITSIHKLSNKYHVSDDIEGTYLDMVLNNNLFLHDKEIKK